MKMWKIPVVWQMTSTINVVADTLEEAMTLAREEYIPMPSNGVYLDESLAPATDDVSLIRECYNGNMKDTD
jgi:hypothetical protein